MTDRTAASNVAARLHSVAQADPDGVAVVEQHVSRSGRTSYRQLTFGELDADSSRVAAGLLATGVPPGARLVLLVPPGIDFVALVFALLKAGTLMVLIDPGIGRRHLIECLTAVEPDGFVSVPRGQLARVLYRRSFPRAVHNVTVGRRWLWGGTTLEDLRRRQVPQMAAAPAADADPAAIIFTSGSTGPPKGVLYRHGNFTKQVDEIRDRYGIRAGEVDVACFPLFALFNSAMGVTTIFPDMDFARPAAADPRNVLMALRDWQATQAFGSPALWNTVASYCDANPERFPSLRRVLSAGAPVPPHVLECVQRLMGPEGQMHTPYGATEALPVASITATEVLGETRTRSEQGAGTCVGTRFACIEWKVIRIDDRPLSELQAAELVPPGEIGELIVRGPVVTSEYVTRREANAYSKIRDGDRFWHRLGDVGYLDDHGRFWYCGRKAHRVELPETTLYSIPAEAIVNQHPAVYRSALVSVPGPPRRAVIVAERWPSERRGATAAGQRKLVAELLERCQSHPLTRDIKTVLLHPQLPVDIRHNSKIFREQVAVWAARELAKRANG